MNIAAGLDPVSAENVATPMLRFDISSTKPAGSQAWLKVKEILPWLANARGHDLGPLHPAAKATEWLLDNEFHIRRAVRQVVEDMPASFYHRLPALAHHSFGNMPRILALAHAMLDAQHMQVSLSGAIAFIAEYQKNDQPLTIAELWAFPAMLRLASLEIMVLGYSALVEGLDPPFSSMPGMGHGEIFNETEQVSRSISALIAISNTPWKMFFESVSRVEEILRGDPAGVYVRMDF